jgi:proline iminopeptidase
MIRKVVAAVLVVAAACSGRKDAGSVAAPPPVATPGATAAAPAAADTAPIAPRAAQMLSGESRLAVDGGSIWYKVSGPSTGTPVVLLHGGPGFSSFYLKPLEVIKNEWPVVRYDQLGAGKSDRITDTSMMTIAHFVRELDSLRSHLGFAKMHLVGHSWGTILALEYYRAHPDHVASLTLSSPALDLPQWARNTAKLVTTLSLGAQHAIAVADSTHNYKAPDYLAAMDEFYGKYVWRHPIRVDLDSLMRTANDSIYDYMEGPSEFTITGTLKNYNATGFLPKVRVPVLYTAGEFDEADTATVRHFAKLTPGAQFVIIPGAAHVTTWDGAYAHVTALRAFLRHVDSLDAKKGKQ